MASKAATIRVSAKGGVELSPEFCEPLGLHAGDALDARIGEGEIVLKVPPKKRFKGKATIDPETGFPVLSFGPDAPVLTQERIEELLTYFP